MDTGTMKPCGIKAWTYTNAALVDTVANKATFTMPDRDVCATQRFCAVPSPAGKKNPIKSVSLQTDQDHPGQLQLSFTPKRTFSVTAVPCDNQNEPLQALCSRYSRLNPIPQKVKEITENVQDMNDDSGNNNYLCVIVNYWCHPFSPDSGIPYTHEQWPNYIKWRTSLYPVGSEDMQALLDCRLFFKPYIDEGFNNKFFIMNFALGLGDPTACIKEINQLINAVQSVNQDRESFYHASKDDLSFTEAERNQVYEQLGNMLHVNFYTTDGQGYKKYLDIGDDSNLILHMVKDQDSIHFEHVMESALISTLNGCTANKTYTFDYSVKALSQLPAGEQQTVCAEICFDQSAEVASQKETVEQFQTTNTDYALKDFTECGEYDEYQTLNLTGNTTNWYTGAAPQENDVRRKPTAYSIDTNQPQNFLADNTARVSLAGLAEGSHKLTIVYGKQVFHNGKWEDVPDDTQTDVRQLTIIKSIGCHVVQPVGGTVQVSPLGGRVGDTITVTATPHSGYQLKQILVDGRAIAGTTFTLGSSVATVTAEFEKVEVKPSSTKPHQQSTPTTGYDNKLMVWLLLLLVSGGAGVVLTSLKCSQKHETK